MDKQYVVGVDVGGQTSKIGVVDARGDVLVQSVIRTDGHSDAADFIAALAAAIKELVVKADKVGEIVKDVMTDDRPRLIDTTFREEN